MAEEAKEKPKQNLAGLRTHLFAALEGLGNGTMEVERAAAVAQVSQAVIASAKVELDFLKLVGQERLPGVVDPEETARFLAEPPAPKGLSTGKNLGTRVS